MTEHLIIAAAAALAAPLYRYRTLQIFQLSRYRPHEYAAALKRCKRLFVRRLILALLAAFLSAVLYHLTQNPYLVLPPTLAAAAIESALCLRSARVKLVLTARMKRFLALHLPFGFVIAYALSLYPPLAALYQSLGAPLALAITHLIIAPLESQRNSRYVRRAEEALQARDIIRIGITGSWGKTTAKTMLAAMLRAKYHVETTPENHNTPMGVARAIFNLPEKTEVFIAEMGARYLGDIAELCRLVHPKYALVTAVGNQHLETFGSIAAIKRTKYELVDYVEATGGTAVLNASDDGSREFYHRTHARKLISGKNSKTFDVTFSSVRLTTRGTEFTLSAASDSIEVATNLLGGYIPSAAAQCAALALELGISLAEIKIALEGLKPVAHRLELLYNGRDVIIDDAYNANLSGAAAALEVLSRYDNRVRVLITPGLVELGNSGYESNRRVGEIAGKSCDYAIFVGSNAAALRSGADIGGMKNEQIAVVGNLPDAIKILETIKGERAILFENDLPDDYK